MPWKKPSPDASTMVRASPCRPRHVPGERKVAVPPGMAAKAALVLAFRRSGVTCSALATSLGIHEKTVRRMLNPRHHTTVEQIHDAMRVLGQSNPD